jgi:hypothetical protein
VHTHTQCDDAPFYHNMHARIGQHGENTSVLLFDNDNTTAAANAIVSLLVHYVHVRTATALAAIRCTVTTSMVLTYLNTWST